MNATGSRPPLAAWSILLVEDNPGDADIVREYLTQGAAHRLELASNLTGALEALGARPFDAVLLDLHLPDGVGVDCVTRVRAAAPDVPIVTLTGFDDDALAIACLEAGAQDYIPKPEVRTASLRRAIGYAIARSLEGAERRRADSLQARMAAIVETSSDAIFSTGLDGTLVSWNRGAERIFGVPREDAVGRPVGDVLPPFDDDAASATTTLGEPGPQDASTEIVRRHRDGRRIDLSAVSCVLRDAGGAAVGVATILRDITERKRRDEELQRRNDELVARDELMRALTERLLTVREEERTRVSREVHDVLGPLLTGLKMDLRWIARRVAPETLPQGAAIAEHFAEAERLADSTVETVQRIALELRPSVLDSLGLSSALRDEARRFSDRYGVATEVIFRDEDAPDPRVATALFRVLQELLTNVARHANATRVRIAFGVDGDAWTMTVHDDGVGFRGDPSGRRTSLGLVGIRERAQLLGGGFTLLAAPAGGTIATVSIPRRAEYTDAEHPRRG